MRLSRNVSEINGDFSRKTQIRHRRVIIATSNGVRLGIMVTQLGVDKLE